VFDDGGGVEGEASQMMGEATAAALGNANTGGGVCEASSQSPPSPMGNEAAAALGNDNGGGEGEGEASLSAPVLTNTSNNK
jgi:hypothetical protein